MAIFEKFSYKYGLTKLTEEQERIFVSKYGPIEKLEYGPTTNTTNTTNVVKPAVDKAQAVPQKDNNVVNVVNDIIDNIEQDNIEKDNNIKKVKFKDNWTIID